MHRPAGAYRHAVAFASGVRLHSPLTFVGGDGDDIRAVEHAVRFCARLLLLHKRLEWSQATALFVDRRGTGSSAVSVMSGLADVLIRTTASCCNLGFIADAISDLNGGVKLRVGTEPLWPRNRAAADEGGVMAKPHLSTG